MIDIIHNLCGGVAFYSYFRPSPGEPVVAGHIVLLDLSQPTPGTAIVCGACGCTAMPSEFRPEGGWASDLVDRRPAPERR